MTYNFFLKRFLCLLLIFVSNPGIAQAQDKQYFNWENLPELPAMEGQSEAIGVAGAITGISNGALIVAGGANFDKPYWGKQKQWHDDIWVLENLSDGHSSWKKAGDLSQPLAYSAVVSTDLGVVAMGGNNSGGTFSNVILLTWDSNAKTIIQKKLPSLPKKCSYGSATVIENKIYLAGGTEELGLETAMKNFWSLDISNIEKEGLKWEELPSWPGKERAFNLTISQHNGRNDCVFVLSGRKSTSTTGDWDVLSDMYEYNPQSTENPWRRRADMPSPRMAGTSAAIGQNHIFVLSGADGTLYKRADQMRDQHPGFPNKVLAYNTITDTWFSGGTSPVNLVTTHAFKWNDDIIIASGEIKPRTRSPQVIVAKPIKTTTNFGWVNISAIIIYLLVLVGIGVYFSSRNKSTDDFFRGGQRVPWWAAGCSIFATTLSSLTFMSVPAKTYATDWLYFLINMDIIILAPFIIYFVLPFFRKIDATSAYEYLELRFNLACRLFASVSYILFQVGRMAIVMYLPSLALATVTPISIETCIIIMGLMSVLYSTMGGVEAVIWTDTLQTFVLLGGAILTLVMVLMSPHVGAGEFMSIATADQKLRMIDLNSDYTSTALWVIVLGGIGQTIIPYASDQGVVQRYMSVSSEKKAAQSIWTNAGLAFIATCLFFSVGTALYVFYKKNPTALDPTYQTDAVFPLFIANQLPIGIAGIVVAGIFAAAQSTISTSMNSISTAITTDFARRFDLIKTESGYLNLARVLTVIFGALGTIFALVIAYADIKSLWDSFISILGLLGGGMGGLFMLGIFTTKTNGKGALIGAIAGAVILWLVQQNTDVSFLLYASIGITATLVVGYLVSRLLPTNDKNLDGLTIFSLKRKDGEN